MIMPEENKELRGGDDHEEPESVPTQSIVEEIPVSEFAQLDDHRYGISLKVSSQYREALVLMNYLLDVRNVILNTNGKDKLPGGVG